MSTQGETASAGEHAVSPPQDSHSSRAGHQRQGEDHPDRLGLLYGSAQKDANGPQDRPNTGPSTSPVLAG